MTNPDDLLSQLRALVYVMPQAYPRDNSPARLLADTFDKLDAHLTAGGTPPEAWREGPDAPTVRCEIDGCQRTVIGTTVDDVAYCSAHVPAHGDGRE